MIVERFSLGVAQTGFRRVPRLLLLVGYLTLSLGSIALFHAQASAAQRHPAFQPTTAVSKTWYFADGRVGAGFQEYMTLSNPDPFLDCTAQIQYLPEGSVSPSARALQPLLVQTVTVAHASRFTTSVNQDLHITQQQNPGILLSTLVTVTGCFGLVAERPMYFNFRGISSGSDVVGATKTSTSSYFADVPTSTGNSSFVTTFLSIMNPPSGSTATVTARYYAAGAQVGSQSIMVAPGVRGTLTPGSLRLPAHVGAIITSNHPVVVERAIYRHAMSEGVVGVVSSASTVMGSAALSNHWLFAEGYANARSQENLLLTNLSGSSTTATITLEYQNLRHQTLTHVVAAHSQVLLDVNQLNAHPTGVCDSSPCAPTPEVSADITATSSSLLAERQMFFHYNHTLPSSQINLVATGGTDVVGATAAAISIANFAEGYTNVGYNEWLTLQNPSANPETLTVTLRNGYSHVYTLSLYVNGKSRATVDITAAVRQHLVQAGNDSRAYQVSLSVQSMGSAPFVAERPMYFHPSTLGMQGGSDVISFATPLLTFSSCTELNTSLTPGTGIDFITAGPDGNVWIAEFTTNKIAKVTPAGVTTEYTVPTASSGPEGITTGSDGNIWFTEYNSNGNKIGRVTPAGVFTEYPLTTAVSHPKGITAGPDGNLWFTEQGTNEIGRITTAGVITEFAVPTASNRFLGITAGPDGNVWFVEKNHNQVGRITPAGVVTEFSAGSTASIIISYITTGPDGNLWVSDYNSSTLRRITPAGVVTEFSSGITAGSGPYGIAAGPDGNVWFVENNTTKLAYITMTGVVTEIDLGVGTRPVTMTLGPDNNIWFSDYTTGKIGRCTFTA